MKTSGLLFASLLVLPLAVLAAGRTSQASPQSFVAQPISTCCPSPSDYIVIEGNVSYTVPAGRHLLITGVGRSADVTAASAIFINSVEQGRTRYTAGSTAPTMVPWPAGLVADPGDVVEASPTSDARVYGILLP